MFSIKPLVIMSEVQASSSGCCCEYKNTKIKVNSNFQASIRFMPMLLNGPSMVLLIRACIEQSSFEYKR